MQLYITRHGETVENRAGILQGHNEGRLSQTGIEQAEKLSERLKKEKFDIIYSSDLGRASKTAEIISRNHKETSLIFSDLIRERNFGEFQGKTKKECGWDRSDPAASYPEPLHGESIEDVFLRAEEFYKYLLSKHKDDSVLVVGHGFIGKILLAVIQDKQSSHLKAADSLKNTSLSIFEIDSEGQYEVIALDSISHLE
ncbi:MAG: histidine phosphatase family protein [Bacteroidales bacterium]|nr:histidine phosphatase family protein [Bacteroidales bacterium]